MLVLASAALVRADDGDLLLNDFEGADFGDWKTEGAAFGPGPAHGTLPGQMEVTGFLGKGLANSFHGGDGPTGKLTSPEFTIERDYLTFLIGGGGYQGKTCMNLLVGGDVVLTATGPNTEPGGSEFLNWENWDVKKYRSKKAVIQIVDDASGDWGHINVDQISQSNTPAKKKPAPPIRTQPAPAPENAREVAITGKYLIFPISNKWQRGRMTIRIGDQWVHNLDCDFPTEKEAIDWWGWLDMAEYQGKTALISTKATPEIAAMIESSNQLRHLQPLYDEALRPQFHISQMRGWNNDPNGMCYFECAEMFEMKDDKVTLRVLVDRPMFEAVGGGGACYKNSARRDMGKPLGKISLTAQGGTLTVESLEAHEMTSTWKNK